jgi:hypothetical protein
MDAALVALRLKQVVDIHHYLMPAQVALDVKRPHAVRAHVAQRHRLDWFVEVKVAIAAVFYKKMVPTSQGWGARGRGRDRAHVEHLD